MQTIRRVAYALASFDNKNQFHETYTEKKAGLEACCKKIEGQIKKAKLQGKTLAVTALYSDEKNITACIYKGRLFVGFQDRKTKEISLNDKTNSFVFMPASTPEKLETRMLNTIASFENNRENQMSAQLTPEWEKLAPMLDKIIDYEKEFEKLPEQRQRILEKSGVKEQAIDEIIHREEKQLHPLIEKALEDLTNTHGQARGVA